MRFTIILIFILIAVNLGFGHNQNIENALRNKIYNDLSLTLNDNKPKLNYDILNKNDIPDYKLFEITIIEKRSEKAKIHYSFKVNNYFDQNEFKIVNVELVNPKNKNSYNVKINDKIKIIYNNNNFSIIDYGLVKQIKQDNIITVKNSFGKMVQCNLINNETAEVESLP